MRFVRRFACCALIGSALTGWGAASAQSPTYPAKPVRVVISFPPGGSIDVVPRIVGQKLQERWGQPWVFDNRPGAGGQIAVDSVVRSPARCERTGPTRSSRSSIAMKVR